MISLGNVSQTESKTMYITTMIYDRVMTEENQATFDLAFKPDYRILSHPTASAKQLHEHSQQYTSDTLSFRYASILNVGSVAVYSIWCKNKIF